MNILCLEQIKLLKPHTSHLQTHHLIIKKPISGVKATFVGKLIFNILLQFFDWFFCLLIMLILSNITSKSPWSLVHLDEMGLHGNLTRLLGHPVLIARSQILQFKGRINIPESILALSNEPNIRSSHLVGARQAGLLPGAGPLRLQDRDRRQPAHLVNY